MERAARDASAVAAIRVVPSRNGVEVWVADRITGKTVLAEVVRTDPSTPGDAALRAVELLRASLLELSAPRADAPSREPPAGRAPANRATQRPPSDQEPRPAPSAPSGATIPTLTLAAGAASIWSPGEVEPAGQAILSVRWMPTRIGAEVTALVPITPLTLRVPEGLLDVSSALAQAAVVLDLAPRTAAVLPRVGVGIAAAFVRVQGMPSQPGRAAQIDHLLDLAFCTEGALGFPVAPWARVTLGALAGVTAHRPVLRLADTDVAVWGRPLVAMWFALEIETQPPTEP
jgi:hypothetical protein